MSEIFSGEPRGRRLSSFFVLTFVLSWLAWVPAALASHDWISFQLPSSLSGLVGAFGPTLSALILTAVAKGPDGIGKLLGRLVVWRVPLRGYLFALFWPAALSLIASMVYAVLGGSVPDYGAPPFLQLYPRPPEMADVMPWTFLPAVFLQNLLIGSSMGEEIGWRGFALPRLQVRMSALSASVVLGLIWGLWQLPLYYTAGHPLSENFLGWTLMGIVADAVLFTWLFNNTQGSLVLALLFHASIATTGLFLSSVEGSLTVALPLKWLLVVVIVMTAGAQTLTGNGSAAKAA